MPETASRATVDRASNSSVRFQTMKALSVALLAITVLLGQVHVANSFAWRLFAGAFDLKRARRRERTRLSRGHDLCAPNASLTRFARFAHSPRTRGVHLCVSP